MKRDPPSPLWAKPCFVTMGGGIGGPPARENPASLSKKEVFQTPTVRYGRVGGGTNLTGKTLLADLKKKFPQPLLSDMGEWGKGQLDRRGTLIFDGHSVLWGLVPPPEDSENFSSPPRGYPPQDVSNSTSPSPHRTILAFDP